MTQVHSKIVSCPLSIASLQHLSCLENRTGWTQHDSNTSVKNRVGEIENWVKSLEKALTDVEKEIGLVRSCYSCLIPKVFHRVVG